MRQKPFNCVDVTTLKDYIKTFNNDHSLCVHVEEAPICPLSLSPITQPVVASDGILYDKPALISLFEMGYGIGSTGETLSLLRNNKYYIQVRIACKNKLTSLIHLKKLLTVEKNLTVIARNEKDEDSTIIFIEKFNTHENNLRDKAGYGSIDAYQLRRIDEKNRKVEITHHAITNLSYSNLTLHQLIEHYNISWQQILARSFYTTSKQLFLLEEKIKLDTRQALHGGLYYYKYAGKGSIDLWVSISSLWQGTATNSSKWARDILKKSGILKTQFLQYDANYRIYPIKSYKINELFFGALPNRTLPMLNDNVNNTLYSIPTTLNNISN